MVSCLLTEITLKETEKVNFKIIVGTVDEKSDDEGSKPVHTLHKSQRFSRKLKRRLTQRTFAEARALKKSSKEAVHIVKYAAELVNALKVSFLIAGLD